MAYNVWFVIWPNQKRALGIIEVNPDEKPSLLKKQCYFKSEHFTFHTHATNNGSCSKPLLTNNFSSLFQAVFVKLLV